MAQPKVAILGYHDGSAGQIETWFEEVTGYQLSCFVVESTDVPEVDIAAENNRRANKRTAFPENGYFKGRPLIATLDWPAELSRRGISHVLPLTSDNCVRIEQLRKAQEAGFALVSAIHPTVTVLAGTEIDAGVWINAGCHIGYKAEVRRGVLLNSRVLVEHHNVLRPGCQIDPGVVMAGNVTVEECAHIHTGATIINRITIGREAIVGAGAVVISDVPAYSTVVGVPARVIKSRERQVDTGR